MSYSNVNSVRKHFSMKVVWLFMPQLTQMKNHLPAANMIGSTRKSRKKIIMNNSVEFHMNTHVNIKSVISHTLTRNCIMNIYIQITSANDCPNLLSHGATFRMSVLLPNYLEENVVKGENVPNFKINTSTGTSTGTSSNVF